MSKIKFIVTFAVLSSLLFGGATLAAAFSSAPNSYIISEAPPMESIIEDAVKIPMTPSGTIDWDAYTTYDRETDTCCCSGHVDPDDEADDEDSHKHKPCPKCRDCIDCGKNPCPACCDDGRRCGRCALCNPVTLSDTRHMYNGSAIGYTGALFNSPVYTINYYYTALSGGAALSGAMPYRAGTYMVTAVFSSRAVSSGTLTATMTITPAPLEVGNISVNNKVYDATSEASYTRGSESGFTLNGIFGADIVGLSNPGTPYFSSIHANKAVPVNFVGFKLAGEHAWNYYVAHPADVTAAITPAPLIVNIELSDKTYDMTKNAVIKSVSEPFGVFATDGVPDDVKIGKWGKGTYTSPYPDDAIPVTFTGFELTGEHAGNYYVDASDKIGVIHQAPLTLKVVYDETKVYDTTVDVCVDDIVLDGMMPGDDIEIDAIGELFYTSPDAGEKIPLEFTEFTIKGSSFDYYNITYPTEFVADITKAPLTVEVELFDKVYDGTTVATLKSASLAGVLEDDDVEIDQPGIPVFDSPNAGRNVPVSFTDFTLKGEQAENYYVIQPVGATSLISRAPISIRINDEDLKIGGVLDFETSEDTSGWDIQWYADGEPIPGANGETYTIQPGDVDKEISVKVISPDGNREGEAAPTAPVPYTIILVISGSTDPMGSDTVYFGSPGNMTAYAASKDNGSVSISYSLHNSGYDFDRLGFSTGIAAPTRPGTGSSVYNASPADAVNGVITITATFYHVGITAEPAGVYTFTEVECSDSVSTESHLVTVSQVGNYQAQNVSYSISGAYASAFKLDQTGRFSIAIGASDTFTIQVDVDNAPALPDGRLDYSAVVNVSHDGVVVASIPVNVVINHDFRDFEYYEDEHYHERTCRGCEKHFRGNCVYTPWRAEDVIHVRNCTICLGRNTHPEDWNDWSQGSSSLHSRICKLCTLISNESHSWDEWGHGSATQHARSCAVCFRVNNANHTWESLNATNHKCPTCLREATHNWGTWGAWERGNSTNHSRTRTCTTAGCGRVDTGTAAHTWGTWGQGNATNHSRTCTTCARSNSAAHTWGEWGAWEQGDSSNHTRTRSCTVCSRTESESASHTWGGWSKGNATSHTRSCTVCKRTNTVNHSWGSWKVGDTSNHSRTCSDCGRSSYASHSWVWKMYSTTQCAPYCNTCGNWHPSTRLSHIFGNPIYSQGGLSSKCARCGYVKFQQASIIIDFDPVDPSEPDPEEYAIPGYDYDLDLPQVSEPCGCGCDYGCFDCGNCVDCKPACKTCDYCEGCRPEDFHCHDCCLCDCDLAPPDAYKDPDPEPGDPDPEPITPPPFQPPVQPPINPITPIIPIFPPLI